MDKFKTLDANEAVALSSYNFSEVCGIYPITPASPIAEHIDEWSNDGKLNYFNKSVEIVEMQSEKGAIALVHGALQTGVLASTFTASQGLLLMIPSLYKLSGEMLPAVIHVAARSLSTHSLSIFGDHQDIYATRQTGVCLLASSSVQDAYILSNIAHLSAIKSHLPFIHFFDGFRTSHEIQKIKLINELEIKKLIDKDSLKKLKENALNPNHPNTRGTAENDDIYFQHTESRNKDYDNAVEIVNNYMKDINLLYESNYKPFNYYGSKTATNIIVAMGSVCETIKEQITYLNHEGKNFGLIEVHLYRPFSSKYLLKEIPKTVEKIAVLDRTKEPGSNGEPLYLDIVNALKDYNIKIYGGRYGLSSKNVNPQDIYTIFEYLENDKLFNNWTIGINDDVTNLSLTTNKNYSFKSKQQEFLFYGYGSDGMVSTSKDLIKIIGDNTLKYVQGYFQYDSKKSGGVTKSHIRISKNEIKSTYYVENPTLIVVSKDNYMYKYDILDNIKENGTLLLNTNLSYDELIKSLPNKVLYLLAKKNINLYTIDAYKIVNELGLKNKINTCLEICIFKLIDVINMYKVQSIMKKQNEIRFKNKGKKVLDINNKIIDISLKHLKKQQVQKSWLNLSYDVHNDLTFEETINNLKGDTLPVSSFIDKKNGIFTGGTTILEKRNISQIVPAWKKENCIQCNQCSFVCPHSVIRPFLTNSIDVETIPAIMPKETDYAIAISYKDCTGCGLCVKACPGKKNEKALEMTPYDEEKHNQDIFDYLTEDNLNKLSPNIPNVKFSQFTMPNFEFSGACAGCGETAYIKNLTQIFNNTLVIANATGCSSIYGGSVPSMPYKTAWASSLFEDNAEYGLGMYVGFNNIRTSIEKYMQLTIKEAEKEHKTLFKLWLNNKNDFNICKKVYESLDYRKYPFLNTYKEYILPKDVFIIGGDGFAYDIGFDGLDHVLSTNYNINMLILDTEVYSNTGGQSSKSSNIGSISKFTSNGKQNFKKDLARMAMCYPNAYVATVNIGYNKEQYLKVLKEAKEHDGPSIIIAYSPCINHGIKNGMEESLENSYLATKSGYFPIFRYNPKDLKFTMDSKDIDFTLYDSFLKTQNRYINTKDKKLLEAQKEWAIKRYNYYKGLE